MIASKIILQSFIQVHFHEANFRTTSFLEKSLYVEGIKLGTSQSKEPTLLTTTTAPAIKFYRYSLQCQLRETVTLYTNVDQYYFASVELSSG